MKSLRSFYCALGGLGGREYLPFSFNYSMTLVLPAQKYGMHREEKRILRRRLEVYPPLLCPAGFIFCFTARPVFSMADRFKESRIHAKTDKVLLRCVRSSLT